MSTNSLQAPARLPDLPGVREDWLSQITEDILEPDLAIVDAHHHFCDRPLGRYGRYLLDELLSDVQCGHNVRATIYVQCGAMYRADAPTAMQPVGETEFVCGIAAMSASRHYGECRVAAAIVGHANLLAGSGVRAVLEAHIAAGGGRFRGIRHISSWHDHPEIANTHFPAPRYLLADPSFRKGFAQLKPLGLSFDAGLYHPQLNELTALARAFPETQIIVNHLGGPLRWGPYRTRVDEAFRDWRKGIQSLAMCDNVSVKLGGLGMSWSGFDLYKRDKPASSLELAELWRPNIETCIEAFGIDRCMFESNFPVDKVSCPYAVLWNAFKRIVRDRSPDEKIALFSGTASRVYRLNH